MSRSPTPNRRRKTRTVTFEMVCKVALALPGVEAGLSYGTPAFRVRGKLLARLKEDGGSLVVRTDFDTREALMAADPQTFYITDHYRAYPAILVRLSSVDPGDLRRLFEEAWRRAAPKRLVAAYRPPRAD
jgi:hypothetical protein